MPDKAWKAFERRVAKSFGSQRTPLSGKMSGHTSADVLHKGLAENFFIECKMRKKIAVIEIYKKHLKAAKKSGKPLLLFLHQTGDKKDYILLEKEDFLKILKTL